MAEYPRSGTVLSGNRAGTSTGLATQILIKVDGQAVGAIQSIQVSSRRNTEKVKEVGLDGFLEIVPNQPTEVTLTVERIYFDKLRLPEAFGRIFKNIQHQRIPFNIEIYDFQGMLPKDTAYLEEEIIPDITTFHNCWFNEYSYPIQATNYIITERASIVCEYVSSSISTGGVLGLTTVTDAQGYERASVEKGRRGSLDFAGILNAARA